MKFKKIAALALTAAMLASASVSASAAIIDVNQDAPNTNVTDETIRITFGSEPSTLWGAAGGQVENESQQINAALLDTLVAEDKATGEIVPCLATEWEWLDGTHCQFKLRDGVKMYGGQELTADDVVYSVGVWTEYSANTDTGRFIKGAEKVDDKTVTIEFATEAPDLVGMLTWSNFGIASEADVEAAGGIEGVQKTPFIGSGRYKFVEWVTGEKIVLERNEEYWDENYKGYFKTIECTFTNDAAAREMAVESGDSQFAADMPVMQAATYAGNEAVNVVVFDYGQVSHLWFNMTEGHATADQKVREAIAKCIDFDSLAMVGTAGTGTKAMSYASANTPYFNGIVTDEDRVQDIEGAKALLAEAGYADGLDLVILGSQDSVPTYTVIQECCRQAGINLEIQTPDIPSFVGAAFGGEYDVIVVGDWFVNRNPSIVCFLQQANIDSGFVIGGPKVTTPEIDAMIQEIIKAEDTETGKAKLAELETVMKEQAIQYDLYPEMKAYVIPADLKGVSTIERGFADITTLYK